MAVRAVSHDSRTILAGFPHHPARFPHERSIRMGSKAKTTTAAARSIDDASEQIFRQVEQSGALPPHLGAPEAVGAALCTLSRRLSGGEARDLASALPSTIQAIVQPCATHRDEDPEVFGRREFLETLAEHLH